MNEAFERTTQIAPTSLEPELREDWPGGMASSAVRGLMVACARRCLGAPSDSRAVAAAAAVAPNTWRAPGAGRAHAGSRLGPPRRCASAARQRRHRRGGGGQRRGGGGGRGVGLPAQARAEPAAPWIAPRTWREPGQGGDCDQAVARGRGDDGHGGTVGALPGRADAGAAAAVDGQRRRHPHPPEAVAPRARR
jgi:hypothetical protein